MHRKHISEGYLTIGMVISMCLWGLSWPANKVLTHYCSPANFTVSRYIVVVITMLILLPSMGISIRVKKKGVPIFAISGALLALYSYFFFMGLKKGAPGAGGVLVTTLNPIIAYTINIFLKKRLPGKFESAGLVLGIIAGCVLLKLWDNTHTLFDSGNLFFLLAALTWAVMSKFTAMGSKYGSSPGFSLWQYIITMACLLPFTDFPELAATIHITDWQFWLNLIFSSAIVTAIATTVYFYATTSLGAEKASSFIFLVPVAAAVSSWLTLGEHIQLHTAIGGLLGIVAVYLINKKPATRQATVNIRK